MKNIFDFESIREECLKKIKQHRKQNRYTRMEISLAIGYKSQKGYFDLERGKSKITLEHLVKLANFYQVPIGFFLNLDSSNKE